MEHKATAIWILLITTFIAATISIGLRITSRLLIKVRFWWDDWLAIAGYIVAVKWVILTPLWLGEGLGYHIDQIDNGRTIEELLFVNKLYLYIAELGYAFALFFGKASILCPYYRMFGVTNIKLPIRILLVCSVIWIVVRTIMGIWHCVPINTFWDTNAGGFCAIDDSKFFFGTILVHIVIDVAILSLPVLQIMKLRLSRPQKIAVTLMFMFGIFICIAAVAIIVESVNFDATSLDFTYNISMIVLWATIEVNLVTVSTCLPVLKPALSFILRCGLLSDSRGSSDGTTPSFLRSKNPKPRHLEEQDNSSTYQLADSVHGGGGSSSGGEFENHALDRPHGYVQGPKTHITTLAGGPSQPRLNDGEAGIVVKNETVVRYSQKDMRRDSSS